MPQSPQPIRFSIIDYLNALPLNLAFKDGLFGERAELLFDYPSQCADHLAAGGADVGLISSIEYQRIPGLVIAPQICIASRHEVKTVLLLTRMEPREVKVVALDRFSRSSVALLGILFHRKYGAAPQFVTMSPNPDHMLGRADAALIIGDAALRLKRGDFQVIDLASEWFHMTALPFVFAFWAIREDQPAREIAAMLHRAKEYGLETYPQRLDEIQSRWPLNPDEIRRYFSVHIHYDMGEEEIESLHRFYQYAREAGQLRELVPLTFA